MPNMNATEYLNLKLNLAAALHTGTDAEILAARRAVSRYLRGSASAPSAAGLGITGLVSLGNF